MDPKEHVETLASTEVGYLRKRLKASAHVMNRPAEYTERLLFQAPQGGTADLDESMIGGSMMRQAGGKVADIMTGRVHG